MKKNLMYSLALLLAVGSYAACKDDPKEDPKKEEQKQEDAKSDDDAKTDDDGKSDDDGKTDECEPVVFNFDDVEVEDEAQQCNSETFVERCEGKNAVYCAPGDDDAEIIKVAKCATLCITDKNGNRADCALDVREDICVDDLSANCEPETMVNYCKDWTSYTKKCMTSAEDGKNYWVNVRFQVCNGGCGENGLCIEDDSFSDYEIWD